MTMRTTLALLLGLVASVPAYAAADPVSTTTSAGTYQTAWITLETGGFKFDNGKTTEAADVSLFLGLRDGKAVTGWFCNPALSGPRIVWLDQSTVTLDGKTLRGQLTGRTNLNWGNKTVHDYTYTLDAVLDGGAIRGRFTASFVSDGGTKTELKGKLAGQLTKPEGDKLAAGQDWPHYFGRGYTFAGPASGAKLINDLADARPVWKSEAVIPTAYGSAPDSRYFDRAGLTDSGGGSSSPIIADGKVYLFYYLPRGPVGLDKAYAKYETEADLQGIAKTLFPKREVQQNAVLNHFRTQADEFVVCLDAATGQTLWKTKFPQRGNNYQTHKHRGLFPVGLLGDGVLYQPGTTGRLYALGAGTGKLKWEYPEANPDPYVTKQAGVSAHAPSPVVIDDTVIFAPDKGLVGVDVNTGKPKWTLPLNHSASLTTWKGRDKTLVVGTDHSFEKKQTFAVAINPADGKVVWKHPVEFQNSYVYPLLSEGLLVGFTRKTEDVKPGVNDGITVIHAYRVSETGLESAWTTTLAPMIDIPALAIGDGHVYVSCAEEVFCLNLRTGEKTSAVKGAGGARTQIAAVADGRLFLQPEGRHGAQSFFMLDASPNQLKLLGADRPGSKGNHPVGGGFQWRPPHSWTTAYANQPIAYPVVDGRIFIRGLDAIYCYDLRTK